MLATVHTIYVTCAHGISLPIVACALAPASFASHAELRADVPSPSTRRSTRRPSADFFLVCFPSSSLGARRESAGADAARSKLGPVLYSYGPV